MGIGAIFAGIGAGASIIGGAKARSDAREAGEANQALKNTQANYEESRYSADLAVHREGFEKFRGALTADIVAFGGSADSGTGLLMAQEAARKAKLDELNIITEGRNRAATLRKGGDIANMEARAQGNTAFMGGLGRAIGYAGDAFGAYA